MQIDIVAALLVTCLGFAFSFLYYSPFLAGAEWVKAIWMDEPIRKSIQADRNKISKILFISFIVNFLSFLGISYILHLIPTLDWEIVTLLSIIIWFIVSGVGLVQSLLQQKNVYTHIVSTIDDFIRIALGTSILFIMMS